MKNGAFELTVKTEQTVFDARRIRSCEDTYGRSSLRLFASNQPVNKISARYTLLVSSNSHLKHIRLKNFKNVKIDEIALDSLL